MRVSGSRFTLCLLAQSPASVPGAGSLVPIRSNACPSLLPCRVSSVTERAFYWAALGDSREHLPPSRGAPSTLSVITILKRETRYLYGEPWGPLVKAPDPLGHMYSLHGTLTRESLPSRTSPGTAGASFPTTTMTRSLPVALSVPAACLHPAITFRLSGHTSLWNRIYALSFLRSRLSRLVDLPSVPPSI